MKHNLNNRECKQLEETVKYNILSFSSKQE